MKIAHIVSSYPPYYGGMGNVVFQTAAELSKRGHSVIVYTPKYYEPREIKGVDEEPAAAHAADLTEEIGQIRRLKPTFEFGNAARLPQLAVELDDFDLVHLHYPFFGTAGIVRKWKRTRPEIPLVITYHMDPRGLGWKGLFLKLYSRYYSSRVMAAADKLIASSYDYVEASEAAEFLRDSPEKWLELPFGVDIDRFRPRPAPPDLFARHNLTPDAPTILFVGGMDRAHYFKGIPILLEALLLLKKQGDPVQAVLAGDGELRQEFELRVKAFGLDPYVKFAGYVSNEDLPRYYNMADLLVLPSIHQGEAFGMVLLEAMASGVPVVASDLPGVRTVASDGGWLFETSNPRDLAPVIYDYFLNSPEERTNWRRRVREIVEEKYAWAPIVDKLENIYNGLVQK